MYSEVFKFGPHVQRACAWEALHFATPGLALQLSSGHIFPSLSCCNEADVSMVRVNLSDPAQVQDLIVGRYFRRFGGAANIKHQTT